MGRTQPDYRIDDFQVSLTQRLQLWYEFVRDGVYHAARQSHIVHVDDVTADILIAAAEGE